LIANNDFSVVPLLAAKMNFKIIFVVEGNKIRQNYMKAFIKHNQMEDKIKFIEKDFHELSKEDLEDVNVISK
jgi:tRNA1(Val) A37 N6-methylase TrmN6